MRTLFLPTLLNGLGGDPGVWVDLMDEARAVLLDLGDLRHVPSRKLLRVDHVVVSHTHVDHFIGFDHLLRLALRRERELTLTGPPGFLERVEAKLSAYTWNLIEEYPVALRAQEWDGRTLRAAAFRAKNRLRREDLPDRPCEGTVHAERLFTVEVALLDHGIPVLATALREVEHVGVDKAALARLGLSPGPWLRELKDAVRRRDPAETSIDAAGEDGTTRRFSKADLETEIIRRGPGQRLAYVTDVAFTPENVAGAAALARDADVLICETAFLHSDADEAAFRRHLTARQAGEIARAAGARRLAPFHVSPRYQGREGEILAEAAEAFGGPVLELGTFPLS